MLSFEESWNENKIGYNSSFGSTVTIKDFFKYSDMINFYYSNYDDELLEIQEPRETRTSRFENNDKNRPEYLVQEWSFRRYDKYTSMVSPFQ